MESNEERIPFSKPALSIDDQCAKIQGRGLSCDPEDLRETLARVSYYRLSGYLWWFQVSTTSHELRAGTTMADVLTLYEFDRNLREILSKCVQLIEVWFRAQFTNHLSTFAGPMGYVDPRYFASKIALAKDIAKLKDRFTPPTEQFIDGFYRKYSDPYPPLWMAVEVMSLGSLSKWFDNLTVDSLRKAIAQDVSLHHDVLASYLRQLTLIRNACAHHNRLWNRSFVTSIKLAKRGDPALTEALNGTSEHTVYRALVYSVYIVRQIDPATDIPSRLKSLLLAARDEWLDDMFVPEGFEGDKLWA